MQFHRLLVEGFNMMELVQQLMAGAGVNVSQAEGGAGLLFGLLKEQLSADAFSRVADAVPDVDGLIDAAPETDDGLGGLLGGVASAVGGRELGNLASLAGGFGKLDLDVGMIGKFVPIVVEYLQSRGGNDLGSTVKSILQGN
jgi:hypothetical protein